MLKEKTEQQQRDSLRLLLEYGTNPVPGTTNYGAMILLSPPGDVAFLTPIAPELRGIEIVSVYGERYDIWQRDAENWDEPQPLELQFTAAEVFDWISHRCQRTEADYMAHGQSWLKDVFEFYKVPQRLNRYEK